MRRKVPFSWKRQGFWARIAASEQTIIRFQGDDRHYDMTVSQADKDGILDILYGYEYLERQG